MQKANYTTFQSSNPPKLKLLPGKFETENQVSGNGELSIGSLRNWQNQ